MTPIGEGHQFTSRIRPDTSLPAYNGFGPQHMGTSQTQSGIQAQANAVFAQLADKGVNSPDNVEKLFFKVLTRVNATIEMNERRLADQDGRERIKLEWQHVARIIDRILLAIFVAVTLTTTCAVLFQREIESGYLGTVISKRITDVYM